MFIRLKSDGGDDDNNDGDGDDDGDDHGGLRSSHFSAFLPFSCSRN